MVAVWIFFLVVGFGEGARADVVADVGANVGVSASASAVVVIN